MYEFHVAWCNCDYILILLYFSQLVGINMSAFDIDESEASSAAKPDSRDKSKWELL